MLATDGESYKRFMLLYNFPPFSVGESEVPAGDAVAGRVPLHCPCRVRQSRIQRLLVDGVNVWRPDVDDGRRLSRKVLLKEGEGTSPKYPGAGDAYNSSNPGGGDDRRGGDRDRGPRRGGPRR